MLLHDGTNAAAAKAMALLGGNVTFHASNVAQGLLWLSRSQVTVRNAQVMAYIMPVNCGLHLGPAQSRCRWRHIYIPASEKRSAGLRSVGSLKCRITGGAVDTVASWGREKWTELLKNGGISVMMISK